MPSAITIIKDEHRSIAAVLQGLIYVLDEVAAGRMTPNFALLHAMLNYIEAFPEKLHHPKEDAYLFRILRNRSPEANALLDQLEAEHIEGRSRIAALTAALGDFERTGVAGLPAFLATAREYIDFHWRHMGTEEREVLPLAEKVLTAEDWAACNGAFASNNDPIVGTPVTREFRELFRKIATLAPSPIGVGPSARD